MELLFPRNCQLIVSLRNSILNQYILYGRKLWKENQPILKGRLLYQEPYWKSVCKHILDELKVDYNDKNIDLPALYKKTATELNLSTSQHTEPIFKQILGGCSGVVNGLGNLRNKLGDALRKREKCC